MDLEIYRDHLVGTKNCKISSAKTYITTLKRIEAGLGKPLEDASLIEYQSYFINLKKTKKINYQRFIQNTIKSFWGWYSVQYSVPNPVANLRIIRKEYTTPDILSPDEVLFMIDASGAENPLKLRNTAMICLLADTGIRVSELVNLRMNHVVKHKDRFFLKVFGGADGTKGYRQRQIPFAELNSGEVIAEYWSMYWSHLFYEEHRPCNQPLFMRTSRGGCLPGMMSVTNVQQIVSRLGKKAGIEKHVTPHSFRHFYATYLAKNDLRIEIIQERLGHADVNSTIRYIHLADLVSEKNLSKNPMSGITTENTKVKGFAELLRNTR